VAEALILDAEALNALAHATERGALAERARAVLRVAHDRGAFVRVPAPVLAETCRGPRFDAAIERILAGRGIGVLDLTRGIAQRAGHLLARAGLSSAYAVDAFVVASAQEFSSATIATGDPADVRRLLGSTKRVRVFAL
jgi:predicted nucleic acid-binding protein